MSGKQNKRIRKKAVQDLKDLLASDLKAWLNSLPLADRCFIAFKIMFRLRW
jgi:predicted Co/Zn/Cd cation transporter (cation efflux family)